MLQGSQKYMLVIYLFSSFLYCVLCKLSVFAVRGCAANRLFNCFRLVNHHFIPHIRSRLTSSLYFKMEGIQDFRGAEGNSEPEFHEIPNNLSTNSVHSTEVTNPGRVELPILLRVLQEDGKLLPIGSFTERSITRKVQHLKGITLDRITMVTPTDAVLELPVGAPIGPVAQELHLMLEWEDIPIYVSCLMGNRHYIIEVSPDRAKYEEKKKEMELEAERLQEEQHEQPDALTTLVDCVNEQARIVGELQQQQQKDNAGGSVPRIPQLQGQPHSVGGSGFVPRILSGIYTPSGVLGMNPYPQHKNLKNPDLPTF